MLFAASVASAGRSRSCVERTNVHVRFLPQIYSASGGFILGEVSLVIANTASWSATPGRGSHRFISDGLFVDIKSSVWSGLELTVTLSL